MNPKPYSCSSRPQIVSALPKPRELQSELDITGLKSIPKPKDESHKASSPKAETLNSSKI